ncbi:MAG: hypothetical protein K8R23_15030 [Chthoniobacter sp.]|nr:hypothetical protein [Chthoniobacter sp.]
MLHLLRFGLAALGLQVEDFFDADFEERGMAAFARAAGETGALKDEAKVVDRRKGAIPEYGSFRSREGVMRA